MSAKKEGKHYTLHKTTDGSKPPCAFFARGECRNGAGCKFSHGAAEPAKSSAKKQQQQVSDGDSSSVVSSESEDDDSDDDMAVDTPAPVKKAAPVKKDPAAKKVKAAPVPESDSDSSSLPDSDSDAPASDSDDSDDEEEKALAAKLKALKDKKNKKAADKKRESAAADKKKDAAAAKKAADAAKKEADAAKKAAAAALKEEKKKEEAANLKERQRERDERKAKLKEEKSAKKNKAKPETETAADEQPKKKSKKEKTTSTPSSSTPSIPSTLSSLFDSAMFPVTSFSTMKTTPAKPPTPPSPTSSPETPKRKDNKFEKSVKAKPPGVSTTAPTTPATPATPTSPLRPVIPDPPMPHSPRSTEGSKWSQLVAETRTHPRFNGCLNLLPKEKDVGHERAMWITTPLYDDLAKSDARLEGGALPMIIGIDCEMCETKDPLSGATDSKALCRLSVIDGTKSPGDDGYVLIDTLVKPYWPVSDYRTRINGIGEEDLKDCHFTLRHAQAFMGKLCSSETIIAGHAVHNDLIALKMFHYRVMDSSFLYKVAGEGSAPPSLKDCVSHVIGEAMPKTHDSVNDSAKAMQLLQMYLDNGCKQTVEIVRSSKTKNVGSASNGLDSLFVHRIPKGYKTDYVKKIFTNHTNVIPSKVDDVEESGAFGKCVTWFPSAELCNMAFEALAGKAILDKEGRDQKRVFTKSGDYVCVRRNKQVKP